MQQQIPRPYLIVSLLALGLAGAGTASAQDEPGWSLSGYGTLGMAHSSERNADYTTSVLKSKGAGASQSWSPAVDSRLAVQLDANLDRHWSAVAQVVSEERLDGTYRPKFEWANIKYQVTPELALRVGRIALPMFLTADYRKVGYAYPWVRPPVEDYGSLPLFSSDGIDATLRWGFGRVRNSSQVLFGHDDIDVVAPLHAYARRLVGIANTSDWGALSVRVNVIHAEVTTNLGAQLFDALNALGPAGQALTGRYAVDHKAATIANVGVSYDPGDWFVMGEAGHTRTDSLLGETRNAYASAGWRWKTLTPYAVYSRVRAVGATTEPGLPLAGLPPALAAQVAALNGGVNSLLTSIAQQDTKAIGLRWDLHTNMALKLQYDRVTPHDGSRGTLINPTPDFRSDRPFHVASVTLDFVY